MNAPTTRRRPIAFYTTSPQLTQACRSAFRRNKNLTKYAHLYELAHDSRGNPLAAWKSDVEAVVLSHADEDPTAATGPRVGASLATAFHLLFTSPATHPDQVARWMRATNIRAENRVHVVRVDDLCAPQMSQLLGRVCVALARDDSRGGIIDAYLAGDTLLVRGPKHRMLHVPLASVPALKGKPRTTVQKFEIDPDGSFIYWPDLGVHLGWNQFLQAVNPDELRKVQQRSEGFNKRYGAAIRQVREEAGIAQSKVEGLTERQLRRIEQGECRATTGALAALAKAHSLDPNVYMERLARAMK